ncbi:hypothetical protein [Paenibacillus cineris]|uniref:Uncharacterized protein n=1 Tax=Paenibacillus cineris TaxID=237530 RepID=A0ABQ4LKC5_9BACL|nr:hypothetical protein [Paenibacillus cineris]GIO56845.1 hypothetical protein J21TS7_51630 [Paenibacillus cineris]
MQFEDGGIYVVNYIFEDAAKGQIRAYSFWENDFLLEPPLRLGNNHTITANYMKGII